MSELLKLLFRLFDHLLYDDFILREQRTEILCFAQNVERKILKTENFAEVAELI